MAKRKEVTRVRMTEEQIESYLKHYAKEHDLQGKEMAHAIRRCAATRWAALERNTKGAKKKPAKVTKITKNKAKKGAKAKHKKAA